MGYISRWSDPQITNDLGGQIVLPNEPITVVYRSAPSGTTALFYDFIQNTEPQLFAQWAGEHGLSTDRRTILSPPDFAPNPSGRASEQMASHVAAHAWTITYDEFGYAKVYNNDVAWIQNAAGQWSSRTPPTSQPPSSRHTSAPTSARTCATSTPARTRAPIRSRRTATWSRSARQPPTGRRAGGTTPNPGVAETLGGLSDGQGFMRYVACEGQIQMADIGYSPLPPQLSQFIADAIGRMWGRAPETLTLANCANPRFDPNYLLPGGEQPPPLPDPPGVENIGNRGGRRSGTATTAAGATDTTGGARLETAAAGRAGAEEAVGGGSDDWRDVDPVAFNRPGMARIGRWPLFVVLLVLLLPVVGGMIYRAAQQGRLQRAELGASPPPPPPPPPPPDD